MGLGECSHRGSRPDTGTRCKGAGRVAQPGRFSGRRRLESARTNAPEPEPESARTNGPEPGPLELPGQWRHRRARDGARYVGALRRSDRGARTADRSAGCRAVDWGRRRKPPCTTRRVSRPLDVIRNRSSTASTPRRIKLAGRLSRSARSSARDGTCPTCIRRPAMAAWRAQAAHLAKGGSTRSEATFFRALFFAFAYDQGVNSHIGNGYLGRFDIFIPFIPYAAMSETSSNRWNLSVISDFSFSAWVVERPSRTSWMAA